MNCPTCPAAVLVMADRSGIEIDYCPTCRGVWLDRGELDKIIERNATAAPAPVAPTPIAAAPVGTRIAPADYGGSRSDSKDYATRGGEYPRKKKSSLLGEIFDF